MRPNTPPAAAAQGHPVGVPRPARHDRTVHAVVARTRRTTTAGATLTWVWTRNVPTTRALPSDGRWPWPEPEPAAASAHSRVSTAIGRTTTKGFHGWRRKSGPRARNSAAIAAA